MPTSLEDALYAAARPIVGDAALGEAALARAVVDRSKRYTSERERLSTPTDRLGDLAARACFFSIADAMKIAVPIAELLRRDALPARIRVVDVGAGCGAMTLGLIASLPDRELDLVAIDRDADALRILRAAVTLPVVTRIADVVNAPIPDADLVVLGTVLNELEEAARLVLVRRALAAAPTVIIIEPALRDTSRALHAVRDALGAHIFAPCTRQGPCPALLDPDDWCHEDRALTLPPRTRVIATRTGLRDSGMRFSYLVLRRDQASIGEAGAWRVVSAPHVEKGKRELYGCSDAGRVRLRLLKRHRAPANRGFESAERGDVLLVEPALEDGAADVGDRTVKRRTVNP
ncbi:MAG: methyltransferase [Proteobacteria bacterium]|nr:methyltransferase [Pseudomonadota bacterium]